MIVIDDTILFAMPVWIFVLQVIGTFIVAAGATYLAVSPQPTPSQALWADRDSNRSRARRAAR